MERFISDPNIPIYNVSLVIIDGRASREITASLEKIGIRTIKTESIGAYEAIAFHPDIMLHHLGDDKIIVAPNISQKLAYKLEEEGFKLILGKSSVGDKYPEDVAYNVARVGKNAVCNLRYTDEVLLQELIDRKVKIIDVKQGYAKCSISIVNENAIITSDKGIAKTLNENEIDVLLIRPGFIELKGLNYGFIGGATGLISKKCMAFFGKLNRHPDAEEIKNFLLKYEILSLELSETPLLDYGTLVPLKEYPIL